MSPARGWVAATRRFARTPAPPARCELCGNTMSGEHAHLVEAGQRTLRCSCRACALLFDGRTDGRYRKVPDRARHLPSFTLPDDQWDALGLPIDLAFFVRTTPEGRIVALYPSPAGPTESQLALDAWQELVQRNPVLDEIEPDVEALLVHRADGARDYFRAPIDQCYALVGIIRSHWQGVSGGIEMRRAIRRFLDDLKRGHRPAEIGDHA